MGSFVFVYTVTAMPPITTTIIRKNNTPKVMRNFLSVLCLKGLAMEGALTGFVTGGGGGAGGAAGGWTG